MLFSIIKNYFKARFPSSKLVWKNYFSIALPVVCTGIIFASDAFIDNFMVAHIPNGVSALAYASIWTSIFFSLIISFNIIGSPIFAQYWGKNDLKNVKVIQSLRYSVNLSIALVLALCSWIIPEQMIMIFANGDVNDPVFVDMLNKSIAYLRYIGIAWIFISWSFSTGNALRETGNGKKSFRSAIISTIFHIVTNAILLYGFGFGVETTAIVTIFTRIFSISINIYYNNKLIPHLHIWPWELFRPNWVVASKVFRRLFWFILTAIGFVFVNFRLFFWSRAYGEGGLGNPAFLLSVASVLGITTAIFNIFLSSLNSVSANTIKYVGKYLGKNNLKIAKSNSRELIGFHFTLALILSLILVILASFIPYIHFLGAGAYKNVIKHTTSALLPNGDVVMATQARDFLLIQIRNSCYVLAGFSVLWLIFFSMKTSIEAGGLINISSIMEFFSGLAQLGWLAFLAFYLIPTYNIGFDVAYALFFLTDIIKLIIYDILYNKINWAINLTKSKVLN